MKTMREYIDTFLCINPAAVILLGLLNGIISFFILFDQSFILAYIVPVCLFLFLAALLKIFDSEVRVATVAKFAIFSMFGWILAFYFSSFPTDNYSSKLPCSNCGAEIKVRFIDKTDPGDSVEWLPRPNSVIVEVLALRISQSERWMASSGKLLLKFPDKRRFSRNVDILRPLNYGETAILQGAFIEADESLFPGAFDYKLYLKERGVAKIYYVSSLKKENDLPPLGVRVMQRILSFRNLILVRMTDGMTFANRKILAALMFGCRYGLDYESRRTFLESGVIHIFAISGLHVGILAFALFLLLRWLPFRLRYLAVPFILSVYVVTTGMHVSALRALLMLSIWSFMKAFLYRTSSLNIVFLTASILLILNPLSLFEPGFQFSFVIAGFLVFAWSYVKEWLLFVNEHNLWIPHSCIKFHSRLLFELKKISFNSFITSIIAWLAGSAVLIMHRSLFIPGALFTNFIIIPFVWLLFVFAVVDLLLLPFFSLNYILEFFLDIVRFISDVGAELGGAMNIQSPPWYLIFIFFVAMLLFFTARRKAVFIGSGLTLFLLLSLLFVIKNFQSEQVVVFHGGESQSPAILILPPGGGAGVTVINPGPPGRVKLILAYLGKSGVNSVDYLVFSENRKSCSEGAWMILAGSDVRHLIFPPDIKRSRYAKFAMQRALQNGSCVSVSRKMRVDKIISSYKIPSMEFLRSENGDYSVSLKTGEWGIDVKCTSSALGERSIKIHSHGKREIFDLVNSNKLGIY